MTRDNNLQVNFLELADRWITVELKTGEMQYKFFPSHLPYDSMRELADGLGNLLSRETQVIARWNDEPVEHEFAFTKTGEQIELKVYLVKATSFGKQREEVFAVTSAAYAIIRPFWKALRELETRYSSEEYLQRLRYSFPTNEMSYFTQQFEKLKLTQK